MQTIKIKKRIRNLMRINKKSNLVIKNIFRKYNLTIRKQREKNKNIRLFHVSL